MALPLGQKVDTWPRPLPLRQKFQGQRVMLEPLTRRHAPELLDEARFDEDSFSYISPGPWRSLTEIEAFIATCCANPQSFCWAIRPVTTGRVSGVISFVDIEPVNAAIELGNIWFGSGLRQTRAATEAVFILMRHAMDDLGYRRIGWTCNAHNAPAKRAALRFGFTYEGTLRARLVVKEHEYDLASFSLLARSWSTQRQAFLEWLDESNFDAEGNALRPLQEIHEALMPAAQTPKPHR